MAVKISLPCAATEGTELIQAWTKFCNSKCIDANSVETSAVRLPDIAKAKWWAMYSYEKFLGYQYTVCEGMAVQSRKPLPIYSFCLIEYTKRFLRCVIVPSH